MLRVTQLSDTHFSTGGRTHDGFGYDTDETAVEVFSRAFGGGAARPDLVVVTGDVADRGQPDEYRKAADVLASVPAPIAVLSGNHDFQVPFEVGLPRPGVTAPRTMVIGQWLFVFADTNHDGRDVDADGRVVDRRTRVHDANGRFGPGELAWLHEVLTQTDAEHVFVWLHHPPYMPGVFSQPSFDAEMDDLLASHPRLRGVAGGHVHTDRVVERRGRRVFVCPALTVNIDLDDYLLLPPGYRTFEFGDDGTVTSEAHLVDDPRWPRAAIPEAGVRYLQGAISWEELAGP